MAKVLKVVRFDKKKIEEVGREWTKKTEETLKIRERKRAIRDIVGVYFNNCVIPKLNQELTKEGFGYFVRGDAEVSYILDGALVFEPYLQSLPKEKITLISFSQAEELSVYLNHKNTIQEFRKIFPMIEIKVQANHI
ncbi:MAG: hypothetical protein AAB432_01535 [Patescibacteria group bacterium]